MFGLLPFTPLVGFIQELTKAPGLRQSIMAVRGRNKNKLAAKFTYPDCYSLLLKCYTMSDAAQFDSFRGRKKTKLLHRIEN